MAKLHTPETQEASDLLRSRAYTVTSKMIHKFAGRNGMSPVSAACYLLQIIAEQNCSLDQAATASHLRALSDVLDPKASEPQVAAAQEHRRHAVGAICDAYEKVMLENTPPQGSA